MKIVIVALAAIAAPCVVSLYGRFRWRAGTRNLRARLDAARAAVVPGTVDFRELDGLPAPVQRYFRIVLKDGQRMVAGVRVQHRGTFNAGGEKARWKSFASDQRVIAHRPGFDWDGRIAMAPGVSIRVHDAYIAGEGILRAAILGAIPVADLRGGGDIAEGELMRFLAEAVWYPTALLPSQGVRWKPCDANSAWATVSDGANTATLLFRFDLQGLIEAVQADARGRTVGRRIVPTPWHGRVWNYQERAGMLVPLDGEAAWLLSEGAMPYWRGHIAAVAYEFAA
ncbi:hypothetical protein LIG30_2998 [Burkholderia sp. lig30]|jgi:hypothetical protein|uniref:DUF6920 family protein n=1 Tax=Burkholderia sp. lig30 TaxID=1192124 RepID=UPI00046184A7|nr:DUF6544 family protein [Burkholderia sp. lig30]KDB07796.1 hypothetical protein LIG30_2998 [Burkholderia sp. lig30]